MKNSLSEDLRDQAVPTNSVRSDIAEYLTSLIAGSDPPNDPISMSHSTAAKSKLQGKTVLLTGAGGTIGSELGHQILHCAPKRLILFELSETALYLVDQELRETAQRFGLAETEIIPVLGSVTDSDRLQDIFARWRPETVFHAAAYKHVPLVEANPLEGIRNNILGTWALADAAQEFAVRDFILISTDKAVRPTNIMGATKRGAEQIVQAFAAKADQQRFSMVRFGNVLGSSGSVVPLFLKQIAAGGPITLTHRDVSRYFMTIPQATQLVLEAAGMAEGGEMFVLDMGEAVGIADLAEAMVQLSGLTTRTDQRPHGQIEIRETGLRPGEKLCEELIIGDNVQPTSHERIMMAREHHLSWDALQQILEPLQTCRDREAAIALLQKLVPEFGQEQENILGA